MYPVILLKELKQMYEWIEPNTVIPVHGEFKHLNEHIKFAKKLQYKESNNSREW